MKIKKWLPLLLAGVMTLSVIGFAGCDSGNSGSEGNGTEQGGTQGGNEGGTQGGNEGGTQGGNEGGTQGGGTEDPEKWNNQDIWLNAEPLVPTSPAELPTKDDAEYRSKNISVHDPSIFHDPAKGGKYYAFGTHYAVASSIDLIEWDQYATDTQWQKLYGDAASSKYPGWPAALESTLDVVRPNSDSTTTWAPDVEYYNGKYYMYYSITKAFGSNESAIGRVEADKPTGPYGNNVVIVESVGDNTSGKPNCIDSELFYDKDGGLWMVYGSFFGGIYIKELYNSGTNWGLPKEEGYGKLLWRGTENGVGVEGPYVFYNASTGYYYLMVSSDDLNTRYNMRIARSESPNGPYTDITGNDVTTSAGVGNKLAGNYKFSWANGFAALGHNSVIKDKNGRYFVVYHTRRQEGTGVSGGHNLYVSQLYFNEEGWPVMAPTAYVGEKAGTVTEAQVTGEYEFVLHSAGNSAEFIQSKNYTLTDDGKVTSGTAEVGAWELKQNYYITITIDGVEYNGVVAPGWNTYNNKNAVFSITAVSDAGRALWGVATTAAKA